VPVVSIVPDHVDAGAHVCPVTIARLLILTLEPSSNGSLAKGSGVGEGVEVGVEVGIGVGDGVGVRIGVAVAVAVGVGEGAAATTKYFESLGMPFVKTVARAGPGGKSLTGVEVKAVTDHPAVGSTGRKASWLLSRLRSWTRG
jgi:hypothetical protein